MHSVIHDSAERENTNRNFNFCALWSDLKKAIHLIVFLVFLFSVGTSAMCNRDTSSK